MQFDYVEASRPFSAVRAESHSSEYPLEIAEVGKLTAHAAMVNVRSAKTGDGNPLTLAELKELREMLDLTIKEVERRQNETVPF